MESDGIKSILAAESEASMEVKKARDERAAEISKAKEEAREETRKMREEREAKFAEEFDSKSDDTASQDQERIKKMKEDCDKSESQFLQNKQTVVELMLGLVTTVDLKVPQTLKYKLQTQHNIEF
jgi:vacuolar-type H+-ATPase subunit H